MGASLFQDSEVLGVETAGHRESQGVGIERAGLVAQRSQGAGECCAGGRLRHSFEPGCSRREGTVEDDIGMGKVQAALGGMQMKSRRERGAQAMGEQCAFGIHHLQQITAQ